MSKRLFSFAFCLALLFTFHYSLFAGPAFAQGEFETDYDALYTVNQDGKTNVTQKIVLKNKTANYYAEKFELKIGSTKVEDVKAADNVGPLETNVKFAENTTSIEVKFNQKVID